MENFLVVGASRGLGHALVRAALAGGHAVTAVVRDAVVRDAVVRDAAVPGWASPRDPVERLTVVEADVRSDRELANVAARLPEGTRFSRFIYNAAVHLENDRRDLLDASTDDMLQTIDVNAVGAVRAVRHFRRCLKDDAVLALISSEAGSIQNSERETEYGYCMSKAALNMFARLLGNREAKRSKVDVVAIHPGWLRTDMGGPNARSSAQEAAEDILNLLESRATGSKPLYVDRLGEPIAF